MLDLLSSLPPADQIQRTRDIFVCLEQVTRHRKRAYTAASHIIDIEKAIDG